MPRHGDRFLLSSWPDNPVIGAAEGIRKERRKTANVGKGGKNSPAEMPVGGRAGAERGAAFRASPSIPHAPACQGWG